MQGVKWESMLSGKIVEDFAFVQLLFVTTEYCTAKHKDALEETLYE
jgi:hypothetical protein